MANADVDTLHAVCYIVFTGWLLVRPALIHGHSARRCSRTATSFDRRLVLRARWGR